MKKSQIYGNFSIGKMVITMKKQGLILEGGATRGVFTAGVLDYLMEQDCYFPYVVGVSAGACNAIDYVSRQKGRTRECMIIREKQYSYLNKDLKKMLRNKSLFDMDMIFDRFPREIFPFDFETYFSSSIQCQLVVTNCITGKAEYMEEKSDKERLLAIARASSSMPLASPMVYVDRVPYLDGGISDSVPIIHSLKTGHQKNVIVLTRNYGYRKKIKSHTKELYLAAYRKYPNLARALISRARVYNRTLDLIEKWELQGRVYVIRPQIPPVSRVEQNYEVLTNFYQHGYDRMKEQYDEMMTFLNGK